MLDIFNTFVCFYSVQSPQRTGIKKKQQRQQNSVVYKQPLDRHHAVHVLV